MNAYIKRRDKSLPRDSNGIWDNISAEPATDAAMSSCVCGPHVGPDPWSTSESTSSRRTRHNGRASPTRSCDECPRYESDSEPASIRATRLQHARIPLVVHMQVPFTLRVWSCRYIPIAFPATPNTASTSPLVTRYAVAHAVSMGTVRICFVLPAAPSRTSHRQQRPVRYFRGRPQWR